MPKDVTIQWGPFQKHLKLTAGQERVLDQTSPLVVITGPPGCGKTATLMLKGLEWLQAGHDVIVFGLHALSFPASRLVYCQLSESYKRFQEPLFPKDRTWGRVRFEHQPLRDARVLESTLRLLTKYGTENLHVLMDDFSPDDGFCVEMMLVFMRELRGRVPGLHLWATSLKSKTPEAFRLHLLTEPTRYPIPLMLEIKVVLEVLKEFDVLPPTHIYSEISGAAARSRPDIIHIRHNGKGEQKWPLSSQKCGRRVGKLLRDIGVREDTGTSIGGAYMFRDVLILGRNSVNTDAFTRGLESTGIPVQVLGMVDNLEAAFDHVILAKQNKVTLMNFSSAGGLDRPVVVCLTGSAGPNERYELTAQDEQDLARALQTTTTLTHTDPSGRTLESVSLTSTPSKEMQSKARKMAEVKLKTQMEIAHRVEMWSRASEQLIVVHLPKGMEAEPSGSEDYSSGRRKCVIL